MVDNIYQEQFTWEMLEEFLLELAKESTKVHKTICSFYYKNDEYWKEKRLTRR